MTDEQPAKPSKSADKTGVANAKQTEENPVSVDASQLTPEEQMALFEKDLKENDWGHQPC